ncbi:MAG TPA: hypothetical protein VJT81_18175 [Burkholderiales bacterium]|nr:hypothetical protein [Burkholderiales bacterium]
MALAAVESADYPRLAFLLIPLVFLVARCRIVIELHCPSGVLARGTTSAAIDGILIVL